MDLLAGAAFSWCIVYVLLAVYFGILAARRAEGGADYATFAATCVLMGAYAFCNGRQYHESNPDLAARWGLYGFVVAPIAAMCVVHTALLYAEVSEGRRRSVVILGYSLCGALTVAIATGLLHRVGEVRTRVLSLGPIRYAHHQFVPTAAQPLAFVVFIVCCGASVYLLARAYVAGKREALLGCVGGFIQLGAIVNDMLVMGGVQRTLLLSEHGFSAFAFGLSYTLLARHERLSGELTRKGRELRRRARQLHHAYEELRAAQGELVRKEQLALVGELAAVVSHEVRNPLAIIANAVAGLRREGISDEDRSMLLSILDEETERLNRLVGDLLRYAKPLHVERAPIDFAALLARASELSRPHPDVRLVLDVASAPGGGGSDDASAAAVHGDANLLRQVFDNLVQNACQAMENGGTLTVRARASIEDGVDGVVVDVADTGEGMDTQVRSRAGTPFFTTRPGGTGLGLAICDRIVTAHGGVLSINSRSGEGTVVSVFLPFNASAQRPSGAARLSQTPGRGSTLPPLPRSGIATEAPESGSDRVAQREAGPAEP